MRMHNTLVIGAILLLIACNDKYAAYRQKVMQHRAAVTYTFLDKNTSPLPASQLASFKGLSYFEVNPDFLIEASFKPFTGSALFGMPHTMNRTYNYREAGTLSFEAAGQHLQLMAYQREGATGDSLGLFIPFTDLTSGKESYGGGRYIDVKAAQHQDKVLLDFNMAYNPYCAYNAEYSCPIPPKQNHLPIAVAAGERYQPAH